MLTFAEYENLWNDHFDGINGLGVQPMPPYNEYLEAENMLEDYLDIFRGVNTRNERGNGRNEWYYEHPFFNGDTSKLEEETCIKYIMIGEARPKLENKPGTYFYNVNHLGNSSWLTAPYKALCNGKLKKQNKLQILLNLASKGYLLIDLYPFSIKYKSNIRENIEYLPFWNLLTAKLCRLTNDQHTHKNLFCKENAKIGFSGPAATHHRIVLDLVEDRIILPNCHNFMVNKNDNKIYDMNGVEIPHTLQGNFIRTWLFNNYLLNENLVPNIDYHSPIYQCECWDASFVNGPNSIFIRTAFNL